LVKDGGEQHSQQELQRNPLAQVPTLELDSGEILTQSMAIMDYLEQMHPQPSLYPKQAFDRARCLQLAEMINSGIQPLQNLSLLLKIAEFGQDKLKWGHDYIKKGLEAVEYVAQQSITGAFLVGDTPTIADFCLIPQLYNARRFKVDLSAMPRLCEVETKCRTLEAFQKAEPEVQSDAQ
jgi:maleylacetoacetate isomerase